jgi:hypothetical protein
MLWKSLSKPFLEFMMLKFKMTSSHREDSLESV